MDIKKNIPTIADITAPSPFIKEQLDAIAAATAAGAAAGVAASSAPSNVGTATGAAGSKKTSRVTAKTTKVGTVSSAPIKHIIDQLNEVKEIQQLEEEKQKQKIVQKKLDAEFENEHEKISRKEEQLKRDLDDINKTLSKSLLFKSGAKKAFEGITNFIENQLPGLAPLFSGARSVFNAVRGMKEWWQDRQMKKAQKQEILEKLKQIKLLKEENKERERGLKNRATSEVIKKVSGTEGGFGWHDALDIATLLRTGKGAGKTGKVGSFVGKLLGLGAGATGAAAGSGVAEVASAGAATAVAGGAGGAGMIKGFSKLLAKSPVLKFSSKLLGPLAVGFSFFDAMNRFKKGDPFGGILSIAAGFATLIPGWGVPISIGLDLINWFRDLMGMSGAGQNEDIVKHARIGGGASEPINPDISREEQARTTSTYKKSLTPEQRKNIKEVADVLNEVGFKGGQTSGLVSEIGRETAYRSRYMYGKHKDAANFNINEGIISFQGSRRASMLNFVKQYQKDNPNLKILDSKGNMMPGRDTLKAQLLYVKKEMGSDPAGKKFLANENVSREESERLLAKYIGWAADKERFAKTGFAASRSWRQIGQDLGVISPDVSPSATPSPAVTPNATPNTNTQGFRLINAHGSLDRSSKIPQVEANSPVVVNNIQSGTPPIKPPMPIPSRRADREAYELLTIAAKIGTVGLLQV